MDTQTTFFFALILAALVLGNVATLWILFSFARKADRIVHRPRESRSPSALRSTVEHLESASARLADWSHRASGAMARFEGECANAETWLQYGFAKLDFNVDKASARIENQTRQVIDTVSEPLERAATIVQGMRALLELISLGLPKQEDEDPRSAA